MRTNPLEAIGQSIKSGVSVREALNNSIMNYEVDLVAERNAANGDPILDAAGNPRFFQAIRRDTKQVLASGLGQSQVIFQNVDAFTPLAEAFVESGAKITRATVLEEGARVFLGFEWDAKDNLSVKGDLVGCRAMIQGGHNGQNSHSITVYPLRLACVNGLMVPVPGFGCSISIKHTERGVDRLAASTKILKQSTGYFANFGKIANILSDVKVTSNHAKDILESVKIGSARASLTEDKVGEILNLFNGRQVGGNHEALKGTAWGLLNAGAESADYGERGSRIRLTAGSSEGIQRFKRVIDNNGSSMLLKLGVYDALMSNNDLGLKDRFKVISNN